MVGGVVGPDANLGEEHGDGEEYPGHPAPLELEPLPFGESEDVGNQHVFGSLVLIVGNASEFSLTGLSGFLPRIRLRGRLFAGMTGAVVAMHVQVRPLPLL